MRAVRSSVRRVATRAVATAARVWLRWYTGSGSSTPPCAKCSFSRPPYNTSRGTGVPSRRSNPAPASAARRKAAARSTSAREGSAARSAERAGGSSVARRPPTTTCSSGSSRRTTTACSSERRSERRRAGCSRAYGATRAAAGRSSRVGWWASIDDTLAHHKGPHIFGLGCHLDAVRSSRKTKVFTFGHVWVVLALVVPLPFARRGFALPILFRLYRSEKQCAATGATFRKKTELAREMLDLVVTWLAPEEGGLARRVLLAIDSGYANATVLRDLPRSVEVVGAMRPDAALATVKGMATLSPKTLAADEAVPWERVTATLYGREQSVEYKTEQAPWARVCGALSLRIVVVRCAVGELPLRVFFDTDGAREVRSLLESYAFTRWPIEVTFRDLKQWLGLAEAGVRREASVLRVVPFVGMVFSLLGLWHLHSPVASLTLARTDRPWYRTKETVAFADILQVARKCLRSRDFRELATGATKRPSPQLAFVFATPPSSATAA